MQNIETNLSRVREEIARSANACGRSPGDIILLAVSKTKPASSIRAAAAAGQLHFGENYLQEAAAKIEQLDDLDLTWHFIGPIQSNKTRQISALFDWVHSVERVKIARRLAEQRPPHLPPLNILIQVNIDQEASKAGILPAQIGELASQVEKLQGLRLRGLMAIPAFHPDPQEQARPLARMAELFNALRQNHPQCDTLSMGMSADMGAAIAQGSTLVRIGTAIFGAREPKT